MPLALACVLLDVESSGGKNVFSALPPSGCGQPRGSEVTEQSYAAYVASRDRCGQQGIGPLQLTWRPYQDEGDSLGGCWRPEVNCWVGFKAFASLLQRNSVESALSRWNTGQPGSSAYATKALGLLPGWQRVVDG